LAEQKPIHFDLIGEFIRLRKRVDYLERNKTGYNITGIIHLGEPEPEEIPTAGPGVDEGGLLFVQNGALMWIATTNIARQIGQP
jgi:hypothetical protein